MSSTPAGCVSPGFSDDIRVSVKSQRKIDLNVQCGDNVAFVKIIVHDRQGHVVTEDVTVTLWNAVTKKQFPGSALDSSLGIGSGGYTEEISVPAETLIQAKATGAPLGYVDTVSGPAALSPGEHGSIDIILGETNRGEFTFQGASLIFTPATPGSPVQVFVQSIVYNDTTLTDDNSDVVVLINGEEYNATYIPITI
jgi:hypothetical protein